MEQLFCTARRYILQDKQKEAPINTICTSYLALAGCPNAAIKRAPGASTIGAPKSETKRGPKMQAKRAPAAFTVKDR